MFHNRPFTLALLLLGTAPLPLAAQQADTAARQGVQTAQTSPASSEPWSLARCLEYARANNLQVQSARITAEAGDIELEAAKAARYPTLSFNTGQNVSHQSAIKLINDYGEVVSDGSFSYGGSYGIGSTTAIYQGGRLRNNVRQQERRAESSRLGVEKSLNDITVNVVQAYLQVMYAAETVEINRRAVTLAEEQADRAQRMLEQGAVARTEVAQMLSQLGSAQYDLTTAQNNLAQYRLQLKQLLELGPDASFDVEFPEISDDEVLRIIPSVEEVYDAALGIMPETRQGTAPARSERGSAEPNTRRASVRCGEKRRSSSAKPRALSSEARRLCSAVSAGQSAAPSHQMSPPSRRKRPAWSKLSVKAPAPAAAALIAASMSASREPGSSPRKASVRWRFSRRE